jgi:hypothetical protein
VQKAAKKKKIHSFKSKARLEQMELTQNKRQNAWHQFQTSKGKSKKVSLHHETRYIGYGIDLHPVQSS